MRSISRKIGGPAAALGMLVFSLARPASAQMEQIKAPRETGAQWALLVHSGGDASGDGAATRLADTLVESYGYSRENVLVLE